MTFVQPGDRIAVTGASGFVGQTLVEHLAISGYEVVGISEPREPPPRISNSLYEYHDADLAHAWPKTAPVKGIVHLAGLAAVGPSFERPQDYINTNSAMVTHLFEHVLRQGWKGRAIIVSSGAVYGSTGDSKGLTEYSPSLATSPYVVSKLLIEQQTEYYRQRGLDALVARPFNHIGPGQRTGFIVPDLATKVREWQPDTTLAVKNLDSARDYTDVRDIVGAYEVLLEQPQPRHTTYNVCSGYSHSGWEVLKAVCTALGKEIPPVEITDHRAIDPSVITGSAERLKFEMGWEPTIEFQTSIDDFVAVG
jgi:GDP-4-dehydro-6-deoxy-D-mannose reductase